MSIKHSVLIITYNHEEFIDECLNSIVNQTEVPYEVVISDDCSKDNTWKIIKGFKDRYPDLFRIHQNKENLGIFKNLQKIRTYPKGNVVNFLAGDDLYKPETLENISTAIKDNDLNPDKDFFIVALNSVHLYPDGKEWVWNNYKYKDWSPMRLKLRFGISFRSIGFSKLLIDKAPCEQEVVDMYPNIDLGADSIKGFEELRLAEKMVFVDYPGPVY